jgi:hypothetical protein
MASRFFVVCLTVTVAAAVRADEINYQRDVRPILSANCFSCHGADEKHREAELRLDTVDGATALHDGHAAIVPGKPDESLLIARITSDDSEQKMPPMDSGKTLTPAQIETLRRWIQSGAEYQQHWAFVPPVRPEVPQFKTAQDQSWIRNPIDAFVLQRLQKEGLVPSERASFSTLLRRVSLDLTGLPPAIEEQDAFAANPDPDGWNGQIERLLKSPHFGEKWARHWLDAARYADSDGFE